MPTSNEKWLTFAEAGEQMAVDGRTIKRWMGCPAKREAFLAVRHGKQWRIPRPDDVWIWGMQTGYRLRAIGVHLKPAWEKGLSRLDRECSRYQFETYRLWLAACMKALQRGSITQEARDAILILWQVACEILAPLPRHEMQADKLKSRFSVQLLVRRFHGVVAAVQSCSAKEPVIPRLIFAALLDVCAVMRYWPAEEHFKRVRAAYTLGALEQLRSNLDYTQAARDLEKENRKPTAENLRPLLHHDMIAHINDTREELPGRVIKARTPEELRPAVAASIYLTNQERACTVIDMRQPQEGLSLRSFRKRHPRKQQPQRDIITAVYRIRGTIPGVEEKP